MILTRTSLSEIRDRMLVGFVPRTSLHGQVPSPTQALHTFACRFGVEGCRPASSELHCCARPPEGDAAYHVWSDSMHLLAGEPVHKCSPAALDTAEAVTASRSVTPAQ